MEVAHCAVGEVGLGRPGFQPETCIAHAARKLGERLGMGSVKAEHDGLHCKEIYV